MARSTPASARTCPYRFETPRSSSAGVRSADINVRALNGLGLPLRHRRALDVDALLVLRQREVRFGEHAVADEDLLWQALTLQRLDRRLDGAATEILELDRDVGLLVAVLKVADRRRKPIQRDDLHLGDLAS